MSCSWVAFILAAALAGGCELAENYADPDGPRFAGDHAGPPPARGATLKVVTYNLRYALDVPTGIAALQTSDLAGADVILMQELDAPATEQLAAALGLRYVYYPASVHTFGRDFGPAVLTPHPIVADHKVILPHRDPINGRLRTATAAVIDVGGVQVAAYSVHTSIISLGLGARLAQVDHLMDDAAGFAGPVIIGGDFNTGDPGAVDQTRAAFDDRGWTWASAGTDDTADSRGLSFLLDFVFTRDLARRDAGVYRGPTGSDHRPVWAITDAP